MSTTQTDSVDKSSEVDKRKRLKKIIVPWTKEEDELLLTSIQKNGVENWGWIAVDVPHRTRKQCRERYFNNLASYVNKQPWSSEEDELIIKLQKQFGNRWTLISSYLPGRAPNSVKNRFCSHITRMLRKESQRSTSSPTQFSNLRASILRREHREKPNNSVFIPVPSSMYEILQPNL